MAVALTRKSLSYNPINNLTSKLSMVTLRNLETATDWIQPGNVGDDGGGSPKQPNGTFTMSPAQLCSFSAKPSGPYNNGYWYRLITGNWSAVTHYAYRLKFMLPTAADLAACQAIEFELQQNLGDHIYNMAWQADIKGSGLWRSFDYNKSLWVPTDIKVDVTAGEWCDIEAKFFRCGASLTHLSLSVNGTERVINISRPCTPMIESDYLHAAFQLDSDSQGAPYSCLVDDIGITLI